MLNFELFEEIFDCLLKFFLSLSKMNAIIQWIPLRSDYETGDVKNPIFFSDEKFGQMVPDEIRSS